MSLSSTTKGYCASFNVFVIGKGLSELLREIHKRDTDRHLGIHKSVAKIRENLHFLKLERNEYWNVYGVFEKVAVDVSGPFEW